MCFMNLLHHQQMVTYTELTTDSFMSRFICITILCHHMHHHLICGSYQFTDIIPRMVESWKKPGSLESAPDVWHQKFRTWNSNSTFNMTGSVKFCFQGLLNTCSWPSVSQCILFLFPRVEKSLLTLFASYHWH